MLQSLTAASCAQQYALTDLQSKADRDVKVHDWKPCKQMRVNCLPAPATDSTGITRRLQARSSATCTPGCMLRCAQIYLSAWARKHS